VVYLRRPNQFSVEIFHSATIESFQCLPISPFITPRTIRRCSDSAVTWSQHGNPHLCDNFRICSRRKFHNVWNARWWWGQGLETVAAGTALLLKGEAVSAFTLRPKRSNTKDEGTIPFETSGNTKKDTAVTSQQTWISKLHSSILSLRQWVWDQNITGRRRSELQRRSYASATETVHSEVWAPLTI